MLDMGGTRDYFLPAKDVSMCKMLSNHNQHQWSQNGIDWVTPPYLTEHTTYQGGSADNWPKNKIDGDARKRLSLWGHDVDSAKGGCCSTSYSKYETGYWGQSFTFAFGMQLEPPPLNTGIVLFATVTSTTVTNNVYWTKACQMIPEEASFLMYGAAFFERNSLSRLPLVPRLLRLKRAVV
jgi:hypothetical protein